MVRVSVRQRTPLVVRAAISPALRERSFFKGLTIFCLALAVWATLFSVGYLAESSWIKAIAGVSLGFATGVLFVIGHDASHGSLTPLAGLNRMLARIAFLPSLHPECTWDTGHNKLHHGWSGLRGRDPAYAPISPGDYRSKGWLGRLSHRIYRNPLGFGLYYLVDMWLMRQILCRFEGYTEGLTRTRMRVDFGLVLGFLLLQVAVVINAPHGQAWLNVLTLVLVPFLVWNYVMAFVTIPQHTHPHIPWFDDKSSWSFYEAQVRGTVHVVPPLPVDLMFANIFHHTAHHVDKKIPLYNLRRAQLEIARAYPADVVQQRMTLAGFVGTLQQCQLFDYASKRWVRFRDAELASPGSGQLQSDAEKV